MATALKIPGYAHIQKTEGVRGGKACIEGTRIAVLDVVYAKEQGHTPEQIQTLFSSRELTLGEVYVALGYYNDHRQEIEAERAAGLAFAAGHEQRKAEYLKRITSR